ncbi:MAG: hypothetical protein J6P03_08445 [Opitutales bacterium]|nr:hypothetical protein [Opitutales bacterium]
MASDSKSINLNFKTGYFDFSGAFNAYSVRHIGNIILFAFLLKDLNGSIIYSKSYTILDSSLKANRDSFWQYLRSRKEVSQDLNEPTFVFSDPRNVEVIHANTNPETSEITLGGFSLFQLSKKVKDPINKKQSVLDYDDAFIVAIFKSNAIVHKSFIEKLLGELEQISTESEK